MCSSVCLSLSIYRTERGAGSVEINPLEAEGVWRQNSLFSMGNTRGCREGVQEEWIMHGMELMEHHQLYASEELRSGKGIELWELG